MFVDSATIRIKGGDGGNGCSSFRREKYVAKGGPNGGDGGPGGDVVFVADAGEQNLVDLVYNRHFAAKQGDHGSGNDQHGRRGEDIRIRVPIGTIVRDKASGDILGDLDVAGAEVIAAKGGEGGKGNARFSSSRNRAPRERELGWPGEERELFLELKTIADIGLVGYPNAGKSTLLRGLTDARPKVASYPFTTLNPIVGIAEFPDYFRLTIADIPGLIDGAHDNVGLGHGFLKHIERTRLLLYVLDTAGVDGRTPWEDFHSLRRELELYQPELAARRGVIAANKLDLPEAVDNLVRLRDELPGWEIIPISAMELDHTDELLERLRVLVELERKAAAAAKELPESPIEFDNPSD
jgi:GTP-binding protein